MPTPLDFSFEFPYSPEALFTQVVRRDFIEEMAAALGAGDVQLVELEHGPDGGHALARYDANLGDMPPWAQKFIPPTSKVTERRSWGPPAEDGSRSYNLSIKPDLAPITIKGEIRLAPVGGGTVNTVHFDITATLPMFGRKLEEMSAADVTRQVEGQRDFTLNWMKTRT